MKQIYDSRLFPFLGITFLIFLFFTLFNTNQGAESNKKSLGTFSALSSIDTTAPAKEGGLPSFEKIFEATYPKAVKLAGNAASKKVYPDLFPGIDLVFYNKDNGNMAYDFVLEPGVSAEVIRFALENNRPAYIDAKGDLILPTDKGQIRHSKPYSYQEVDGQKVEVESAFVLADNVLGFELGTYDPALKLIIDPEISYEEKEATPPSSVLMCGEKRLDWDWEFWPSNSTSATFPIGMTEVTLDFVSTSGFGVHELYSPYSGGIDTLLIPLPSDNDSFNLGGGIGNGQALELTPDVPLTAVVGTITFAQPVDQLEFSIYDLDLLESITITGTNGIIPVLPTLTAEGALPTFGIAVNVATGIGTISNNGNNGTVNVSFPAPVDNVILTFANIDRVALSDLIICEEAMSIGNLVWDDINNNGLYDVGENGHSGVKLKLFKDQNSDNVPDDHAVDSVITNGTGHYLFDNLSQGKYLVWVDSSNFLLSQVLDSFSTSYNTESLINLDIDNNDNGLNTYRKNPAEKGLFSGTLELIANLEPTTEVDLTLGPGAALNINSNLTADFALLKDSDFDGVDNRIEGYGDRDNDGKPDAYDFDPAGYIYCLLNGKTVSGGQVSIVSTPPGGDVMFDSDGSNGFYRFFTNGVAGEYIIQYTPPPGYSFSAAPERQVGFMYGTDDILDPTFGSEDNPASDDPLVLGFGDQSGGDTELPDFSAAGNPYFFRFNLDSSDPFVMNNNIPLACDCGVEIDNVNVVCSGGSSFDITVDVTWVIEDPTVGDIQVSIDGQIVTIDPGNAQSGTATSPTITVTQPGFSVPVDVEFLNAATTCTAQTTVDLISCFTGCTKQVDEIGGVAWMDENGDGLFSSTSEAVANVLVELYDESGTLVCTRYTNSQGDWGCTGLTAGETYRIEYSTDLLPNLSPDIQGPNNGTSIQFAQPGTCRIFYAVIDIDQYCEENNILVTSCFVGGDQQTGPNANEGVMVGFPNSAGSTMAPGNTPPPTYIARANEIGATYGLGYHKASGTLLAAAYYKYLTGFGPGGQDAIYAIDGGSDGLLGTTDDAISTFIEFDNVFGPNSTGPDIFATPYEERGDSLLVTKASFGDIDFSNDGNFLYVMNLGDRRIYSIPVSGYPLTPDLANIQVSPPTPSDGNCSGTLRPFAIEVSESGKIYVGMTCESFSRHLYVWGYDPGTNLWDASPALDQTFSQNSGFCCWGSWSSSVRYVSGAIMQGLEIDDNGDLIITIHDRRGEQMRRRSIGDIFKACKDGSGGWTLEFNGECGGIIGYSQNDNRGPGRGQFLNDASREGHNRSIMGGLTVIPGSGEVVATFDDPFLLYEAGVLWLDVNTGQQAKKYSVGRLVPLDPADLGGKQAILGEMDFYCPPIPIQIGNYVWSDENANGIQDAGEPPLPNVPVSLYNSTTGQLMAVTTTAADGSYYFTNDADVDETWFNGYTEVLDQTDYVIVFGYNGDTGASIYDPMTGELTVGGVDYELTLQDTGQGNTNDVNDSDAATSGIGGNPWDGYPVINYSTSGASAHELDAGFTDAQVDLALQKVVDNVTTPGPFYPGSDVAFTITVYNQGDLGVNAVHIEDYIPAFMSWRSGTSGTVTSGNGNTVNVTNNEAGTFLLDTLPPMDEVSLTVVLKINQNFLGTSLTNWAEIRSFDTDNNGSTPVKPDLDSTPNAVNFSESGETNDLDDDNIIDQDGKNGGDEDDHDPARITVIPCPTGNCKGVTVTVNNE